MSGNKNDLELVLIQSDTSWFKLFADIRLFYLGSPWKAACVSTTFNGSYLASLSNRDHGKCFLNFGNV